MLDFTDAFRSADVTQSQTQTDTRLRGDTLHHGSSESPVQAGRQAAGGEASVCAARLAPVISSPGDGEARAV